MSSGLLNKPFFHSVSYLWYGFEPDVPSNSPQLFEVGSTLRCLSQVFRFTQGYIQYSHPTQFSHKKIVETFGHSPTTC